MAKRKTAAEKPRINVKLLARVRDHILEEPRRYDQELWGRPSDEAPCGTAACIAGWTALLGRKVTLKQLRANPDVSAVARELLNLEPGEASVLFAGSPGWYCGDPDCSLNRWPARYAAQYRRAKTARGRARAAANYIDYIIKTGSVT
jgi:hypothetical protein